MATGFILNNDNTVHNITTKYLFKIIINPHVQPTAGYESPVSGGLNNLYYLIIEYYFGFLAEWANPPRHSVKTGLRDSDGDAQRSLRTFDGPGQPGEVQGGGPGDYAGDFYV